MDLHTYGMYLAAVVVLVITPGPDTALVLSRTLASGAKAGLLTLLGTQTGNILHSLFAGLGVSGLILLVPGAFQVLTLVGAAYLLWMAWGAWNAASSSSMQREVTEKKQYFRQGLLNNLVNPKVVVFFLALFPQFLHPEAGYMAAQSLLLGATLAGVAVLWIGGLVWLTGRMQRLSGPGGRFGMIANRLAAVVFAGLALRLLLSFW